MKHSMLLIVVGLSTFHVKAQDHALVIPRDSITKKYTYEEIVHVDSATYKNLFERGAQWFEQQFKTQQLNVRNAETGTLAHAGSFPVSYIYMGHTQEYQMLYTATISVRDGRYKYTFTDFMLSGSTAGTTESVTLESYCDRKGNKTTRRVQGEYRQQVDTKVKQLVVELRAVMVGSNSTKDKW